MREKDLEREKKNKNENEKQDVWGLRPQKSIYRLILVHHYFSKSLLDILILSISYKKRSFGHISPMLLYFDISNNYEAMSTVCL